MHLLLTDRLTCPRCGPQFGLVLRADVLEGRRVREGGLGCPNCREVYPVQGGVGDLRPPPRTPAPEMDVALPGDRELEVAHALLGVVEGPGQLVVLGRAVRFARALAARIPRMEVVAAASGAAGAGVRESGTAASPAGGDEGGVSHLVVGPRLPFYDMGIRGALLEGNEAEGHLREAARVLAPRHRVVVLQAPPSAAEALMAAGLTVQLEQDGVVVAGR